MYSNLSFRVYEVNIDVAAEGILLHEKVGAHKKCSEPYFLSGDIGGFVGADIYLLVRIRGQLSVEIVVNSIDGLTERERSAQQKEREEKNPAFHRQEIIFCER